MADRDRALRRLEVAAAVWGLALAISLAAVWTRPAPPGQLPGYATSIDLDAHAPMRFVIGLIVLPILVPLALRPLLRALSMRERWARNGALLAMVVPLWYVAIARDPWWTLLPTLIALTICATVRGAHFTRHDVVLVPAFATTWLGIMDVAPNLSVERTVLLAAMLVFAVRLAVAKLPGTLPPAFAFLIAPLALVLQTNFFARDQRYFGWHALLFALLTPFVLRVVLRDRRRALVALAFAIYPIAVYAHANATSMLTAEGKPRATFFEDGHFLMPASEVLRGELPYRDVLFGHGLFEDGFFDYLSMNVRGVTIGDALRSRAIAGGLNTVGIYALGWAATGSPHAGLLSYGLAALFGATGPATIRVTPALFALALIVAATRRRQASARFFFLAGLVLVLSILTSLDFAAFTFVTLFVAAFRQRMLKPAFLGLVAGSIPLFLILAIFGIADDYVRGTLLEVLTLGPAYALNLFTPPQGFTTFSGVPEIVAAVFHKTSYLYVAWVLAVLFLAMTIVRKPRRRLEPLVLIALWIALAAVSYAERHHLHWQFVVPAFAVGCVLLMPRRHRAIAVVLLLMIAWPTTHVAVTGWMRQSRGPIDEALREIHELPRARGALFTPRDVAVIGSVRKYVELTLQPDETYFDFSNRAVLHFLLRRDYPIRQYEVAFYQTEERQREVIAALERNPKVRAALMPGPNEEIAVDGVPNSVRAPLVWQYLQENFTPDFAEGEVVFWRRK